MLSLTELESLREEFVTFLVVHGIEASQWEYIVATDSNAAQEWLSRFSDVIMDGVLSKVKYLEHYEGGSCKVFRCDEERIHLIGLDSQIKNIGQAEFMKLFYENPEGITVYCQSKPYAPSRNEEIFRMTNAGADVVNGEWYDRLFASQMP